MVRLTIAALLLLQHSSTTSAFSLPIRTVTAEGRTSSGSGSASTTTALFQYKPLGYDDPDAINMEQPGGVVPMKPVTPIKTVTSAMSWITRGAAASDDQSENNHHDIMTVPSAMSRIERGLGYSAIGDQSENNHHDIKTVPSTMSRIERGLGYSTIGDQSEDNHHDIMTVPSTMSRIELGPASDDQHDLNYHDVKTVSSAMSEIDRGGMGLIRSSSDSRENKRLTEQSNEERQKEDEQKTKLAVEESIQKEDANKTAALPMPVVLPVLTVPRSMSRAVAAVAATTASDDQHDSNYHNVKTIPSAMSKKTKSLPLSYSE